MFSNATFCTLPWSSIQINPSGNFKICCFSGNKENGGFDNHGIGKDADGNVMNVLTHSIEDALNSDLHKQLRLAQSRNEQHPVCQVCWQKENANFRAIRDGFEYDPRESALSHRIVRTFNHMPKYEENVDLNKAATMMKPDGSIDSVPIFLDIRFSNLCNSKCIQCEPQYSNLWYHDHMVLNNTDKFRVGPKEYTIRQEGNKLVSDMIRWHDDPRWWEQFERIKGKLRRVYITGGEPFVQPSHDELLDRLIASGLAQNVTLEYDTNLTAINNKIIDKLNQFQEVRFSVSVDDTEDRYELVRFPCKWETLLKNLKSVELIKNRKPHRLSICVGIPTVYAPIRMVKQFVPMGYDKLSRRLLRFPNVYDLQYLPDEAKKKVIQTYMDSDIPEKYKAIPVGYLKNTLGKVDHETCLIFLKGFKTRMDGLDNIRATDWKATMPDVVELIGKYINI